MSDNCRIEKELDPANTDVAIADSQNSNQDTPYFPEFAVNFEDIFESQFEKSLQAPLDYIQHSHGLFTSLRSDSQTEIADNPFAFSPKQLAKLHDPKDLNILRAMGGIDGLVSGLRTDVEEGLSSDEDPLAEKVTLLPLDAPSLDAIGAIETLNTVASYPNSMRSGTTDSLRYEFYYSPTNHILQSRLSNIKRFQTNGDQTGP